MGFMLPSNYYLLGLMVNLGLIILSDIFIAVKYGKNLEDWICKNKTRAIIIRKVVTIGLIENDKNVGRHLK